jgi:hypothetical protein
LSFVDGDPSSAFPALSARRPPCLPHPLLVGFAQLTNPSCHRSPLPAIHNKSLCSICIAHPTVSCIRYPRLQLGQFRPSPLAPVATPCGQLSSLALDRRPSFSNFHFSCFLRDTPGLVLRCNTPRYLVFPSNIVSHAFHAVRLAYSALAHPRRLSRLTPPPSTIGLITAFE